MAGAIVVGVIVNLVTFDWNSFLSWDNWFGDNGDRGNPYYGPYEGGFDCGGRYC